MSLMPKQQLVEFDADEMRLQWPAIQHRGIGCGCAPDADNLQNTLPPWRNEVVFYYDIDDWVQSTDPGPNC